MALAYGTLAPVLVVASANPVPASQPANPVIIPEQVFDPCYANMVCYNYRDPSQFVVTCV
jgi:hypothetical protein